MSRKNILTEGNIFKTLVALALPIMGTSFVQMAYTMLNMIWVGRMGSGPVAAIGTAGFFTWLGSAIILISRTGAEIGVSQSIGKKDLDSAKEYAHHAIKLDVFLALIYGFLLVLLRRQLIGFFNLGDPKVTGMAISYLVIVSFGMGFYFINPVFTGIFNGNGNSRTPFIINTVGLITNMILDPLLIYGLGPFPKLGVVGAGIGTITSQLIVTLIFIIIIKRKMPLIRGFNFLERPDAGYLKRIIKLGTPVALQNGLFSIFAMLIARVMSHWGATPIAVQNVGSQIEAISWMTAGGFSTALSTFVGQNYGAKKWERIYKGYFSAIGIVGVIGIGATCLLIFGAKPIFSIFLSDKKALAMGISYLKILGLSQFFMCLEITTAGAFNGLGRTIPPSVNGILLTGLRVPAAILLSSEKLLGLNGVWWAISMSSVLKGVVLASLFIVFLMRNPNIRIRKTLEIL